jgi:hypothetical protein
MTSLLSIFELRSQETFGGICLSTFEDIREMFSCVCLYYLPMEKE